MPDKQTVPKEERNVHTEWKQRTKYFFYLANHFKHKLYAAEESN